jgi:hypothetical protein
MKWLYHSFLPAVGKKATDPTNMTMSAATPGQRRQPYVRDGCELIRILDGVEGNNNDGLHVIRYFQTVKFVVCKLLHPGRGGFKEADFLLRIGPHPTIVRRHNLVKCIGG